MDVAPVLARQFGWERLSVIGILHAAGALRSVSVPLNRPVIP